jgi:hypothetical protein
VRGGQYAGINAVRTILADPQRREVVVRSLQEALSAFAYSNTLHALQEESKMPLLQHKTTIEE